MTAGKFLAVNKMGHNKTQTSSTLPMTGSMINSRVVYFSWHG